MRKYRGALVTAVVLSLGALASSGCGGADAEAGASGAGSATGASGASGATGAPGAERGPAGSHDVYASYADLAAHQEEGRDFRVTVTDRGAPTSVLAFHGGHIDSGTEKIALAVAGSDWNSYVLTGKSFREHVTSANFDDPRIVALARRSARCVSIHGHKSDTPRICVGGADPQVRAEVARSLQAAQLPFELLTHCDKLDGEAPTNPVNYCGQGVQLEFSGAARDQLYGDAALMDRTAQAIRQALDALPAGGAARR